MAKSNINILMIEDLKVAQLAALNLFSRFDCKLHIVGTAASALERVLLGHYDIIFIDIQLPDINGFELAQTIRNIERRWTRMPLIAVTANFNDELETKSRSSGFDDYLIKPLTLESVRHVLGKHLNKIKNEANKNNAA